MTDNSQTTVGPSVDLSRYRADILDRGAGPLKEALWQLASALVFRALPCRASGLKAMILRAFGARIGRNVVIKPGVRITFPWKLQVGNNAWLGEDCWILNLAPVRIDDNVCISQHATLCTGNHDYSDPAFSLMLGPVHLEEGAWVGAFAFVAPGVTVHRGAVLTACAMATCDLQPDTVYSGVPARPTGNRWKRLRNTVSPEGPPRRATSAGDYCEQ